MDRDLAQARLRFLTFAFRECVRGLTEGLRLSSQPALAAEEKQRLFAAVETAIQELPDELFADAASGEDGWEEGIAGLPEVRGALERAIGLIVAARKSRN